MATAQATKQEAVTIQQSKVLVKNMIRISVSSICFHRDIFPADCFSFRNYGNMKVIQLDAAELGEDGNVCVKDEKAFLLTQWLERGVFKALEDELLAAMVFAVYTEHPKTKEDLLLETYEFKFSFSKNEYPTINNVPIMSKDDIKTQAAKFIRNLISFTQTLDDLPEKHWITIQIKYHDNAPDEYEAEYFETVQHDTLKFATKNCLKVKLGSIETPHIKSEAKFVGLESLMYENLCQVGEINDTTSSKKDDQVSILQASKPIEKSADMSETLDSNFKDLAIKKKVSACNEESLQKIRKYFEGCSFTTIADCSADTNLSRQVVKEAFDILKNEGLQQKSYHYFMAAQKSPEPSKIHEIPSTPKKKVPFASRAKLIGRSIEMEDISYSQDDETMTMSVKSGSVPLPKKPSLQIQTSSSSMKENIAPSNIAVSPSISQATVATDDVTKKRKYAKIKQPIQIIKTWKKSKMDY